MGARKAPTPPPSTATSLADLRPNTKNPRKPWTDDQLTHFRESLVKFGDLGGIVRNVTTNQLIGGHKRIEAFHAATAVEIHTTPQARDAQGTIAHGYVVVDGSRFAYREVQWSPEDEIAANLAANRWGAEWDWKLVSDALKSITDDDLRLMTGFEPHEINNLMAADWTKPDRGELMGDQGDGHHTVALSASQYAWLVDAKAKLDPTGAIGDPVAVERLCRQYLESQI